MRSPLGCGSSERHGNAPKSVFVAGFSGVLERNINCGGRGAAADGESCSSRAVWVQKSPRIEQLPPRSSRTLRPSTNGPSRFKSDVSPAQKLPSDWSVPLRERHPAEAGPRPLHRRHGNGRKHRVPSLRNKREKLNVC